MTASNDRKRAAVMRLIRKGLLTPDEAAGLTSTPKDLVEYWALREGIDIATTRAIYLLKIWRSELTSYVGFWVTRRSGGVVCRHLDDLDAVLEFDACDDLRQVICTFESPPGL
jgi:hypothetical protein